jgi:predicted RNase H-like nuclease (RuvC/YqgF family)
MGYIQQNNRIFTRRLLRVAPLNTVMGKTDTIKERRVDVYLDTLERKERWTEQAEEAGDSLSTFVQKAVEYAIEQGGPDFGELGEQAKEIQELEDEIADLQADVKQKQIVIEKLESELQEYRRAPFADDDFEGTREFEDELIDVLRGSDQVSAETIRRRLGVEPTETDQMQALDTQLQQLERYGLVEHTSGGWRWVE